MTEQVNPERRRRMIQEAAYFRAERRGFDGGDPVVDWVEAEAEVEAELRQSEYRELIDRLEERVAEAGKKLQSLRKKVAAMQSEARAEWQDDLDRLSGLRDALEQRSEEIRERGYQAGRKLQGQVEEIWEEISQVLARKRPRRAQRSK